jgi:hypothetical protein
MDRPRMLASLLAVLMGSVLAQAPQSVNIRGTVSSFDGRTIRVDARGAGPLEVELPDTVNVSGTKSFSLSEVKPGMVLGVTTVKRADGATVAIDVRPIPATAPLGLTPFDLVAGSTMTNAALEGQAVLASGSELVLNYKSGTVKVLVPPGTPMSQSMPGSRADIKPGETIFIVARIGQGDKLTAARVQVSTNGVKPTQ